MKAMIINGFIDYISKTVGNTKISESEYNTILDIIRNKPIAPEGFDYRLKIDLTWELYELPPMPEPIEEEATIEDYETALNELGVI